jgi:hypothetical protein
MAGQEAKASEQPLKREMFPALRVLRYVAILLLVLCAGLGYLLASWWTGRRGVTQLAEICARVDYINGLQQEFGGEATEELREQFKALVEDCRTALRNRAEESD